MSHSFSFFKKQIVFHCLSLLLGLCFLASASAQIPSFPSKKLQIGIHVVQVEVAEQPAQLMQGLMYRTHLNKNDGMLFKFESPQIQCMWMKNTLIPLSVAFIDMHGKIINIEDMEPKTLNSHCSSYAAFYALEMNRGWFKEHGIKAGSIIKGLK